MSYVKNGIQKGKRERVGSLERSLPHPPPPWASIVERVGYPPGEVQTFNCANSLIATVDESWKGDIISHTGKDPYY